MLKDGELEAAFQTAVHAVAQTSELLLRQWRPRRSGSGDSVVAFATKEDSTPVTEIDRAVEQRIRDILHSRHPQHTVLGEEAGREAHAESPWLWAIDPIDGTKSYIRGLPYFATQLAALYEGEVVIGVSSAPALSETAVARRGGGAFLNDQPLRVSGTGSLEQALIAHGEVPQFERQKLLPNLVRLCRKAWGIQGFQDFWSYHLLAEGRLDAVVEVQPKLWDVAAVSLIVREAGGKATDLHGRPIGPDTTSCVATNGRIHEIVLDLFRREGN